jgi:hypothetical protein
LDKYLYQKNNFHNPNRKVLCMICMNNGIYHKASLLDHHNMSSHSSKHNKICQYPTIFFDYFLHCILCTETSRVPCILNKNNGMANIVTILKDKFIKDKCIILWKNQILNSQHINRNKIYIRSIYNRIEMNTIYNFHLTAYKNHISMNFASSHIGFNKSK